MFADRTNWRTAPNRLASCLTQRRASGLPVIDPAAPLGGDRPVTLAEPEGASAASRRPLLVLLHGRGASAELQNAKVILADYIRYVKTEPLVGHIDANPFGVDTKLRHVLTESLTHMAKSIG